MIAPQQNTQHQRGKCVGGEQPAHFRGEKFKRLLARQDENDFSGSELDKDCSENEKDARVLGKRSGPIDPELHDRGRKKQQCNHEILGGFRLLAAKDQKCQPSNESGKNEDFYVRCRLETAQQFVAGTTTPRFFRSEPAPEKSSAS